MEKYKIIENVLDSHGRINSVGFEQEFKSLEDAKKAFDKIDDSNESIKYCYCYTLIIEYTEGEDDDIFLEQKYFIGDLELALNDIYTDGRVNNYAKLYNFLKEEEEEQEEE